MRFLDCTLGPPGQDLALDASLFRALEATGRGEVLRVWEAAAPAVVVGHGATGWTRRSTRPRVRLTTSRSHAA